MAYVRELDDLPWEAPFGRSHVFRFWAKENGENVVPSASPTWAIYSESGSSLTSGTGTVTASAQDASQSYIAITVPNSLALGERYQLRVTWVASVSGVTYEDIRLFDVVRFPFGAPYTSLNDLQELRSDISDRLNRIGVSLGYATGDTAREAGAAICAYHGRIALEARIRDQIERDAAAGDNRAPNVRARSRYMRPALILDRTRLARVERYEAAAHAYRFDAKAPEDGDDSASQAYRHFRDQANLAWTQVGPLTYDSADTGQSDAQVAELSRVTFARRVQG